jgi:hypothetical protein
MMIDIFQSYKPEIIRVSLSTPFLVKSRCKHCASLPSHYYYIRNATMWFNPRVVIDRFKSNLKYFKKMTTDHYMIDDPKYFHDMSNFTHAVTYKGYRPRLHRTRGSSATQDVVEFLMCECGKTSWGFSDKAIKNRPEIVNKKSRRRFPQKFEF